MSLFIENPRRQLWFILSVSLAVFMSKVDMYIVNVSIPSIAHAFSCSVGVASWVVLSYLLLSSSTILIIGRLGDAVGLRRTMFWGYIIFTIGSLASGLAMDIYLLLVARGVQGFGGAMMITAAFAMIPRFMPTTRMGWACGVIGTVSAMGVVLSAPAGGVINGFFSWRWIFLVNVPVGAIAIAATYATIPDDRSDRPAGEEKTSLRSFDIPGTVLCCISVTALLFALNMSRELGSTSPTILGSYGLSAITFIAMIINELRRKNPLIELSLFKDRTMSLSMLTATMFFMCLAGNAFMLPLYLISGRHIPSATAGLILGGIAMVPMFVSPLIGKLADRTNPHIISTVAMAIGMAGAITFSFVFTSPSLLVIIPAMAMFPLTIGLFSSPNNKIVMSLAPPGKQGAVAGLYLTVCNIAMALGVCAVETVFSAGLHPAGTDGPKLSHLVAEHKELVIQAFANVYRTLAVFYLAGIVLSLLNYAGNRNVKPPAASDAARPEMDAI